MEAPASGPQGAEPLEIAFINNELNDSQYPQIMQTRADPKIRYNNDSGWQAETPASPPPYDEPPPAPAVDRELEDIYGECERARKNFINTVYRWKEEHRCKCRRLPCKCRNQLAPMSDMPDPLKIDVANGAVDWQGILDMTTETKNQYDNVSKVRRSFRNFCGRCRSGRGFLVIFPESSVYASVVCGGIKLILTAAQNLGEVREDVAYAIEYISDITQHIDSLKENFPKDVGIEKAAAGVYISMVNLLNEVVVWCGRKPTSHFFEALGRQDALGTRFEKLQERLERDFNRFRNAVERATHRRDAGDSKRIGETHLLAVEGRQFARQTQQFARQANQYAEEASDELKSLRQEILQLKMLVVESVGSSARDQEKQKRQEKEVEELRRALAAPQRSALSALTIIRKLGVNELTLRETPYYMEDMDYQFNGDDQARAAAMIQEPALRYWIQREDPAILLINGCSYEEVESPISYVSLKLIEALSSIDEAAAHHVVTLFCFCADEAANEHFAVIDMVKTFLAQLLQWCDQEDFDLGPIQDAWLHARLNSLEDVCGVFTALVRCLPRDTKVLVIMDGVSFFEGYGRVDDMTYVVNELVALVYDGETGPVVKVLMTSPSSAPELGSCLSDDERTYLPDRYYGYYDGQTFDDGLMGEVSASTTWAD